LFDGDFTARSMTAALLRGFSVVHIATHFDFEPGDESKSFLLLGDGSHLTLADLDSLPNPLRGIDLLTLSGCNTGVGDGREVEGLGVIAQRKGAKAVIASLWPVADESTSLLMQQFYRLRQARPRLPKAEALRQAQRDMLSGKLGGAAPVAAIDRGARAKGAAPIVAQNMYSHPYFWAPFFLMGNWL
jgi:CHAT domain-containing protein